MGQGASASVRVVQRVAEYEGVEPTALTPPLYTVIDTDALDSLYRRAEQAASTSDVRIEFSYREHVVCIDRDGEIHVTEPASRSDGAPTSSGDRRIDN